MNNESLREFWGLVDALGWGTKTTDSSRAKKIVMSAYTEKECKELIEVANDLYSALEKASGQSICRDSWHDTLCHIIGLGKDEYEDCLKNPTKIIERYENFDYIENFLYCIPNEFDFRSAKLSTYSDWIHDIKQTYREVSSNTSLDKECKEILNAIDLLESGKIDEFLETKQNVITYAKVIAADIDNIVSEQLKPIQWLFDSPPSVEIRFRHIYSIENLYHDIEFYRPDPTQ